MKRLIVGIGMVVGALAIVGAVMLMPKSLGQRTGRWVSPVEAHNAEIELVGLEDRAYPYLARFYARYSQMDHPEEFGEVDPGDEGWDAVEAWVSTQDVQGLIDGLESASKCSVLGVPLHDFEDPIWVAAMQAVGYWSEEREVERSDGQVLLMNALLPMPGVIVQAGHVLFADAQVAELEGDAHRLMRDVRIWSRLVFMADQPDVLIGQLVQVMESAKIGWVVGGLLHVHPELIDESAAAEIEGIFDKMMSTGVFELDLELEKIMMEDIMRRMVDEDGVADYVQIRDFSPAISDGDAGVLPPASLVRLEDIEPELLATYNHFMERGQVRIDAIEMPWEPIRVLDDEETWSNGFTTPAGDIGKILFPVLSINGEKLDKAVWAFRSRKQYLIGNRVALAAHRHWLRHGKPAIALVAIDSDLLAFDPIDGFTGEALQYRWVDGHALVYAVGADGDNDGGVRVETPDQPSGYVRITDEYLAEPGDGDMVLFPFIE